MIISLFRIGRTQDRPRPRPQARSMRALPSVCWARPDWRRGCRTRINVQRSRLPDHPDVSLSPTDGGPPPAVVGLRTRAPTAHPASSVGPRLVSQLQVLLERRLGEVHTGGKAWCTHGRVIVSQSQSLGACVSSWPAQTGRALCRGAGMFSGLCG